LPCRRGRARAGSARAARPTGGFGRERRHARTMTRRSDACVTPTSSANLTSRPLRVRGPTTMPNACAALGCGGGAGAPGLNGTGLPLRGTGA
jgi:hypothetical protein